LIKIYGLAEPQKSEALEEFYHHFEMYNEYVDLVEQLPEDQLDWHKMNRLMDYSHRCKRYTRTVYWGKKILENTGKKDFPSKRSREYINTLENISESAACAGDFDTSLEYAKKLCLLVPERFYFAKSLARTAMAQGKREELVNQLKAFAQEHPQRWVVLKVLTDIFEEYGDESNRKVCLDNVSELK